MSTRRSKRGSTSTPTSSHLVRSTVDLTSLILDSDSDGSRFNDVDNDDVPYISQEQPNLQMVTSEDGRFESFKSPLMASVVTGSVNCQGRIEKMVKVSVKWGLATKHNEKQQISTATTTSQNDDVASAKKFEVNEKIYAVDNGVRFEATVLSCGDDPVDGEGMKYHVQIKSFKNSYKKWLSAENMKKRVVEVVGMKFNVETEEEDDGEVEIISTKPCRTLRSRKKSPRSSPSNQEDQGESNCNEAPTSQRGAEDIYNMQTDKEREEEEEVQVISTSKSKSPVVVTLTHRRSPRIRSVDSNETSDNTKETSVGTRVGVCLKDGPTASFGNNVYGTITKVSRDPQPKQNKFTHHIKIMHDNGEREETYYPNPDITLDSSNELDAQPKAAGPNDSIGSNLFSKDGDEGKDKPGDKQRGMPKRDSAKVIQQGNASNTRNIQPDAVKSSTGAKPTGYDKADYETLKQRYLMPRVREKAELANGITLRRQYRDRLIDQKTPGFKLLKTKVDSLLKKNYHAEVYRLLCQLRDWELNPEKTPAAFHEGNRCDGDVKEVLDLTKEDDGPRKHCIDVDEYITDVLLVDVKKEGDGKQSPHITARDIENRIRIYTAKKWITDHSMSLTHSLISAKRPMRATSSIEPAFFAHLKMQPSDDQKKWLLKFGDDKSKLVLNNKEQRLFDGDIVDFTNSLKHTHNCDKGEVMGRTIDEYTASSEALTKFWGSKSSRFCFIPICFGRGDRAHCVGVAIHIRQRKFYIYNSRRVWGKGSTTDKPVDDFVYIDGLIFNTGQGTVETQDGKKFLSGEFVSALQNLFETTLQLDEECNRVKAKWRMKIVNSFFRQQNNRDCGGFVCFFFHAMTLGLPVETANLPTDSDAVHCELNTFRKWIAFSICVNNILK